MFEKYIVKIQDNPIQDDPIKAMNIHVNPLVSKEALRNTLYNFNNYNDQMLFDVIRNTLDAILSEIFNKAEENQNYLNIITNRRFLSIFIRAVDASKLTYDQKIRCNKLAYDYLVSDKKDPEIEKLFFSLSKVVNRDSVSLLSSIGIPESLADYMALSRFSSPKEVVNVKRLNFIIMSSDPKYMTVQNIILIYEKLFDHLIPLFEGIMTDSIDDDADYMTDDMWMIYSCISLAILEIVNNRPTDMIIALLRAYYEVYIHYYGKIKPRFNINSINSDDYKRILACLDLLKMENVEF